MNDAELLKSIFFEPMKSLEDKQSSAVRSMMRFSNQIGEDNIQKPETQVVEEIIKEQIEQVELDEEAIAIEQREAVKRLGQLLRQLKEEKEKRIKAQVLKEAGLEANVNELGQKTIVFEDQVITQKIALRIINKQKDRKKYIIYPDTDFKIYWDYFMTL